MVKYRDSAQLDPSQLGGSRRGSGGKIAMGGGAGLLVVILALVFGLNPSDLLGAGSSTGGEPGTSAAAPYQQCRSGADIQRDRECRFVAYTNSIQSYWTGTYDGYREIQVVPFTGQVGTACGTASAAVGPFYCPGDTTVYLDTGFFDQLTGQLGAQGGDAAEAYVFAHEFGHHIQNLTGVMRKVQSQGAGQTGPKSGGVRLELQADCYAGVWLKHAANDPDSPIQEITRDDLNRAVDAAAAVGDDRIQQRTQGQVTRESWTHGSAAQRQKWLNQGFSSGDPNSCNTFAAGAL
ncbi:MAG: neutral zinc metallopeptidase [Microlunatus sp.]|nr:neutral zinc metallopeptidase [Microlunatus sp.]MDN5770919.1 neutral zinc metallopeptidase [Microlunatus sp.]MDN5804267.1 neutral zinc metallopeptidase [Microlunatus sp.]